MEALRAARGCFCCLATRKLASYHFSVGVERNKVKPDSTLKHTSGLVMKENSLGQGWGGKLRWQVKTQDLTACAVPQPL